jgi:hypothetical protein
MSDDTWDAAIRSVIAKRRQRKPDIVAQVNVLADGKWTLDDLSLNGDEWTFTVRLADQTYHLQWPRTPATSPP